MHLAVDATHAQIATLLGTVIAEADNNDYSYLLVPTSASTPTEIASIEKYTFGANGWAFAYALNNSGFTSAQWAAINSGITSGLVAKLNALPTNSDLLALLAGKQDVLTFDDVPVEGSNNPVKSGGVHSAIDDEKTARVNAVNAVAGRVDTIEGEIPAQASSENQLADKAYVNSSISTNTATYRGSFNLVADLGLSVSATHEQIGTALAGEISTADNNDYAYVQVPTSDETPAQILKVERYKYNGTAWAFEYELNNSGFTSAQWAALNSGITSGLVGKLNALPTNDELTLALAGKQDVLTFDNTPTENSNNPVKSGGVYAADKALSDAIEAILLLIPSAATSLNKLVDTDLMNSSISTATATFRGTFNLVSDLSLELTATHAQIATALAGAIATADNNDYAFVLVPTSASTPTEIAQTDRYKFNGTAWAYEYTLNTSGFTSAQWAAINSGITAALVTSLADIPDLIPSEATSANQLADKAYVVAQILAATPAFKGQFTTLAELQAVASPKAGDLGIVRTKDSDGMDVFTVYQYLSNAWNVFYSLSYHPQTKPATTGTTGDYPYNGMGRVELAKNMVNTGTELAPVMANQLTQDMFYKGAVGSRVPNTNTIFVIQYDYVLAENITIPSGCVLDFQGGSISGSYTINGANTKIYAGLVKIFNTNVIFAGSWNMLKSVPEWFGAVTDDNTVDNSAAINKAFSIADCVELKDGLYYIANTINVPINKSLLGKGKDITTIITTTANVNLLTLGINAYKSGISIKDLKLVGTSTSIGVYGDTTNVALFSSITILNCAKAFYMKTAVANNFYDIYTEGNDIAFEFVDSSFFNKIFGWMDSTSRIGLNVLDSTVYCYGIDIEYFKERAVYCGGTLSIHGFHCEHSFPGESESFTDSAILIADNHGCIINGASIGTENRKMIELGGSEASLEMNKCTLSTSTTGTIKPIILNGGGCTLINTYGINSIGQIHNVPYSGNSRKFIDLTSRKEIENDGTYINFRVPYLLINDTSLGSFRKKVATISVGSFGGVEIPAGSSVSKTETTTAQLNAYTDLCNVGFTDYNLPNGLVCQAFVTPNYTDRVTVVISNVTSSPITLSSSFPISVFVSQ